MQHPDIYWFNPTCETAIANGSETYMAPKVLREFETSLSFLPMLFARSTDLLLSTLVPQPGLLEQLKLINFPLPNCISKEKILTENKSINRIIPWGWSPAAHFQLKDIKKRCSKEFQQSKIFNWNAEQRLLHERMTSAQLLEKFILTFGHENYCQLPIVPVPLFSIEAIETYIHHQNRTVLKAPLSSSGRGVQMIRNNKLNSSTKQWAESVIKQIGYVMAEPMFDKRADLSFQFEIKSNGEVIYLGHSWFSTNENGMYQGNYLNKKLTDLNLTGLSVDEQFIADTGKKLRQIILESTYPSYYEGFLGIDGMLLIEDNLIKLHPCLEINCRPTMGLIAHQIEKLIHPEAKGIFEVYIKPTLPYSSFYSEMKQNHPIELRDGMFSKGFVSLTNFDPSQKFGAYILLQ